MKYIITESQYIKLSEVKVGHLKPSVFRYWDMNGGNDLHTTMKLFSIPPSASHFIQQWLLEWMGGEDELYKMINKYTGRVFRGVAGSYDFKFYIHNARIYSHDGVEIYFDATVDGDGSVEVTLDDDRVLDNVYDASQDDKVGWEVEDEIRDTIFDEIKDVLNLEFDMSIDRVKITSPGKF